MKKIIASVSIMLLILFSFPLMAFAAYPSPGTYGVNDLFLAFTGWTVGSDGSQHQQYWTTNDLQPIITHKNSAGQADGEMFTDYLFMARAIKNGSGVIKYIERNDSSPGNYTDWTTYKNELFASGKNINALYTVSLYNGLGRQIVTDVWIALPYPHPSVFGSDTNRITNVKNWIDSFISTWNSGSYSSRLNLKGFYWIQESEYYQGTYDDGNVMTAVNNHIHTKYVNGQQLKALWIPYQDAASWNLWSSFNFDLSILQPSYYFNPAKSLEKGAADAYSNSQGVEMEMDLGVIWDSTKRDRFIYYMNKGATGGYDSQGRYFGPYMSGAPIGWYVGGWYWSDPYTRQHSIIQLYNNGDALYNSIWEFVKGTYIP